MEEEHVRSLYYALLRSWNHGDAEAYARLFVDDGYVVGFDGSLHDGPAAIRRDLGQIFDDHAIAAYVAKVRRVLAPAVDVSILHAVAGMVPPGGTELSPAANALQTLVAAKQNDAWRVVVFHNTPAAFHGRPEAGDALTRELSTVLRDEGTVA